MRQEQDSDITHGKPVPGSRRPRKRSIAYKKRKLGKIARP